MTKPEASRVILTIAPLQVGLFSSLLLCLLQYGPGSRKLSYRRGIRTAQCRLSRSAGSSAAYACDHGACLTLRRSGLRIQCPEYSPLCPRLGVEDLPHAPAGL